MARAAEQDWGFNDIARKFEKDSRRSSRPARKGKGIRPAIRAYHFGLWFAVIALAMIGLVALHVALMGKNLEYNNLIQGNKKLEAENAQLASDVSALSSPARIERIAVEEFGMIAPQTVEYVYVDPSNARQYYADLDAPGGASGGDGGP